MAKVQGGGNTKPLLCRLWTFFYRVPPEALRGGPPNPPRGANHDMASVGVVAWQRGVKSI